VTRQAQLGVAWTRSWGEARVDLAAYGLGRSLDNALSFGFIELGRKAAGLRAAYSASLGVGGRAVAFTAGADLETQADEREEFDNVAGRPGTQLRRDQTDRVSAAGPFVQAEVELWPAVLLTIGARYDAVRFRTNDHFLGDGRDDSGDRTLRAFSPVAGMLIRPLIGLAAYANVATSFQTPTTTELINAPPAPGQPCCPAGFNEQLEPQRAVSFEAGVKGELAGRVGYDIALFHMNVRNALVPFQVPQAEGREFFRNAGESRHRGLEIGAHGGLGPARVSAAYTYSDFVFIDDGLASALDGNRIPGVPPHHLFAGLRVEAGRGFAVESELDHTSEYFATDANDPASVNPAATVLDLRLLATTRFGRFAARPFIAVNNLTNERYNSSVVVNAFGGRYFEPAPGRNLVLGVTMGAGGWAR
jgi:iron complex outermembrane receptor protein